MTMKRTLVGAVLILGVLVGATSVLAQQPGPGQGRRQFDPEQMRARMMDRMKENLQASDDEWQVIEPKITKVMELQRSAVTGRGFGGFMGGMRGPRGGDDPNAQRNTILPNK